MAHRMKPVMHSIIDKSQSAFIPRRSISDNIFLAQELFRGYSRETGTPKCALKINLHKAFDSIRWDFILVALRKLCFPPQFISWVEACITTTRFSVKVNGALHGFFRGAKGLRQGDPMTPLTKSVMKLLLSRDGADRRCCLLFANLRANLVSITHCKENVFHLLNY
ncbi:hypothetical protein AgCh_032132 [Apium graveolens]